MGTVVDMPPAGFHYEWVEDKQWRLATQSESENYRCRRRYKAHASTSSGGSTVTCPSKPVAALNRGRNWKGERRDSWWFYCKDHLYGRRIRDGRVENRILVRDEETSS